jgi:hypothetical protein
MVRTLHRERGKTPGQALYRNRRSSWRLPRRVKLRGDLYSLARSACRSVRGSNRDLSRLYHTTAIVHRAVRLSMAISGRSPFLLPGLLLVGMTLVGGSR